MNAEQGSKIILDNGTDSIKAGFSGEDYPRHCVPTLIGRAKPGSMMIGLSDKSVYVGEEVNSKRGVLKTSRPIQCGIIQNWDDATSIWQHMFENELRADPSNFPCLLTEVPLNPYKNREKTMEIMFETFNVPAFYLSISAVLGAYASGRTTGLFLDSGSEVTNAVPVRQGKPIKQGITQNFIGGRIVTQYMKQILHEVNLELNSSAEERVVRDMKEKLCYVATDYQAELQFYSNSSAKDKVYELPDGQPVMISTQRFRAVEAIFNPSQHLGKDMPQLHQLVQTSILRCDQGIRGNLYENVVLSGGNTMFEGFPVRLENQLRAIAPKTVKTRVVAPTERKYLTWIGGSILGSMADFNNAWITRAEYEEKGALIVHQKCP